MLCQWYLALLCLLLSYGGLGGLTCTALFVSFRRRVPRSAPSSFGWRFAIAFKFEFFWSLRVVTYILHVSHSTLWVLYNVIVCLVNTIRIYSLCCLVPVCQFGRSRFWIFMLSGLWSCVLLITIFFVLLVSAVSYFCFSRSGLFHVAPVAGVGVHGALLLHYRKWWDCLCWAPWIRVHSCAFLVNVFSIFGLIVVGGGIHIFCFAVVRFLGAVSCHMSPCNCLFVPASLGCL